MPPPGRTPTVSVLMPAYNAEAFVAQSVQSVLAQTFEDFELLVVNDGSSDRTRDILAGIADPRLRIIDNPRNLGIVGTLNHGMAHATGRYIARIDADDFCLPTRFAVQTDFLDRNPQTVIVTTRQSVLEHGAIRFSRPQAGLDPLLIRWMLLLGNPLGHTAMMFRAEAVAAMGTYLREEFTFAEDFDFSHRMLRHGEIAEWPEHLVIYRQHNQSLTRTRRTQMIDRTAAVLANAYAALLGGDHAADAQAVATHLIAHMPFADAQAPGRLAAFLDHLLAAFIARHPPSEAQMQAITRHVARLWWGMMQSVLRAGQYRLVARHHAALRWSDQARPSVTQLARVVVGGLVPAALRPPAARPRPAPTADSLALDIHGTRFLAEPVRADDPPSLYFVVDAQADAPADPASLANPRQARAQDILDRYGARPIYLVDDVVAANPAGYGPLRAILDRHAGAIGARLHPPAPLPPEAEAQHLAALTALIACNFGVAPLFFRAPHLGPGTLATLARLGFAVDFSLAPGTDQRADGGSDLRAAIAHPYRAEDGSLLAVPPTSGRLGALALDGGPPDAQLRLIRTMAAEGCRIFVLTYASRPLIRPGAADSDLPAFLAALQAVCTCFFEELGGMPGHPADLLPQTMRQHLWPTPWPADRNPSHTSPC